MYKRMYQTNKSRRTIANVERECKEKRRMYKRMERCKENAELKCFNAKQRKKRRIN